MMLHEIKYLGICVNGGVKVYYPAGAAIIMLTMPLVLVGAVVELLVMQADMIG